MQLAFCHFLLLYIAFSLVSFTQRNLFMVTTLHAEVTFSHSPALVPIAVRYLVGTVTSRFLCYKCISGYTFFLGLNMKQDYEMFKDIRVSDC